MGELARAGEHVDSRIAFERARISRLLRLQPDLIEMDRADRLSVRPEAVNPVPPGRPVVKYGPDMMDRDSASEQVDLFEPYQRVKRGYTRPGAGQPVGEGRRIDRDVDDRNRGI